MKAIKCEMCGSTDFVKQDGMYICQHCRTKYTVEEAKKFMVEIDDTTKLPTLYERARKSIEVNDLAHAAEYYKEILDITPRNWEAYFYSYLGEYASFTNAEAPSVLNKLGSTIPSAYDMAIEGSSAEEATSRVNTITTQAVGRILGIVSCGYSLIAQYEHGSLIGAKGTVTRDLYNQMRPLAQNIVLAGIGALEKLDAKIITLSTEIIAPEVIKNCRLLVRRNMYDIANHDFWQNEILPEKFVTQSFIMKYAQAVIDLGGFNTCKGEEVTILEIGKTKAVLMLGNKKQAAAKGDLRLTNYKLVVAGKKPFEKSLENLYNVTGVGFYLFLYFTDNYVLKIFGPNDNKTIARIKNTLRL